jgi:hypothetical protein
MTNVGGPASCSSLARSGDAYCSESRPTSGIYAPQNHAITFAAKEVALGELFARLWL